MKATNPTETPRTAQGSLDIRIEASAWTPLRSLRSHYAWIARPLVYSLGLGPLKLYSALAGLVRSDGKRLTLNGRELADSLGCDRRSVVRWRDGLAAVGLVDPGTYVLTDRGVRLTKSGSRAKVSLLRLCELTPAQWRAYVALTLDGGRLPVAEIARRVGYAGAAALWRLAAMLRRLGVKVRTVFRRGGDRTAPVGVTIRHWCRRGRSRTAVKRPKTASGGGSGWAGLPQGTRGERFLAKMAARMA